MSNVPNELPNLEGSLSEISLLIEKMEHSELTLEQSLGFFERGIKLVKHCQKILEETEQKIQILIKNNHQESLAAYTQDDNVKGQDLHEVSEN